MTEDELQQKRQEFRDQEFNKKVSEYMTANEYRSTSLQTFYRRRKINWDFGKVGWSLVGIQAFCLVFFSFLWFFSYIPFTKFIVNKVLP